jgi:hypothetical protein
MHDLGVFPLSSALYKDAGQCLRRALSLDEEACGSTRSPCVACRQKRQSAESLSRALLLGSLIAAQAGERIEPYLGLLKQLFQEVRQRAAWSAVRVLDYVQENASPTHGEFFTALFDVVANRRDVRELDAYERWWFVRRPLTHAPRAGILQLRLPSGALQGATGGAWLICEVGKFGPAYNPSSIKLLPQPPGGAKLNYAHTR